MPVFASSRAMHGDTLPPGKQPVCPPRDQGSDPNSLCSLQLSPCGQVGNTHCLKGDAVWILGTLSGVSLLGTRPSLCPGLWCTRDFPIQPAEAPSPAYRTRIVNDFRNNWRTHSTRCTPGLVPSAQTLSVPKGAVMERKGDGDRNHHPLV